MTESQGSMANKTGHGFEEFIEYNLLKLGYELVHAKNFDVAKTKGKPVFARHYYVKSMYGFGGLWRIDLIIFHPTKWPNCLIGEVKWQQGSGTVDEKYPFVVGSINVNNYQAILFLDGDGYKPEAEKWVRSQTNEKFIAVLNMREFQTWLNKGRF